MRGEKLPQQGRSEMWRAAKTSCLAERALHGIPRQFAFPEEVVTKSLSFLAFPFCNRVAWLCRSAHIKIPLDELTLQVYLELL